MNTQTTFRKTLASRRTAVPTQAPVGAESDDALTRSVNFGLAGCSVRSHVARWLCLLAVAAPSLLAQVFVSPSVMTIDLVMPGRVVLKCRGPLGAPETPAEVWRVLPNEKKLGVLVETGDVFFTDENPGSSEHAYELRNRVSDDPRIFVERLEFTATGESAGNIRTDVTSPSLLTVGTVRILVPGFAGTTLSGLTVHAGGSLKIASGAQLTSMGQDQIARLDVQGHLEAEGATLRNVVIGDQSDRGAKPQPDSIKSCTFQGYVEIRLPGPAEFSGNRGDTNAIHSTNPAFPPGGFIHLGARSPGLTVIDNVMPLHELTVSYQADTKIANNTLAGMALFPMNGSAPSDSPSFLSVDANQISPLRSTQTGTELTGGQINVSLRGDTDLVVTGNMWLLKTNRAAFRIEVSGRQDERSRATTRRIQNNTGVGSINLNEGSDGFLVSGNRSEEPGPAGNVLTLPSFTAIGHGIQVLSSGNTIQSNYVRADLRNFTRGISVGELSRPPTVGNRIEGNTVVGYSFGIVLVNGVETTIQDNRSEGANTAFILGDSDAAIGGSDPPEAPLFNNRILNNVFKSASTRPIYIRTPCRSGGCGGMVFNVARQAGLNVLGGPFLGGNFWSDYTGLDVDGDGVGDVPHPLGTSYVDAFPLAVARPALIVNTTSDAADANPNDAVIDVDPGSPGDQISLRAAIQNATVRKGVDRISFAIPSAGPHVIRPRTALPPVGEAAIDGDTQARSIIIDGTDMTESFSPALTLLGGNTTVKGLAITRFKGGGIQISSVSNVVQGCFFGTDFQFRGEALSTNLGNRIGITMTRGAGNVIGGSGPGATNVIVGSNFSGIVVNTFGMDDAGPPARIEGNIIAGNGNSGLTVVSGKRVMISRNAIYRNGTDRRQLGIDLGSDGVTPNDPGDADDGPNELLNFPIIDRSRSSLTNIVMLYTNTPNKSFTLEIFASRESHPSLHGEGERFLGAIENAQTDAGGRLETQFALPAGFAEFVTLTVTDEDGNTSEFSPSFGPIVVNDLSDKSDASLTDGVADVDLQAPGLQTTLRSAIEFANRNPGFDTITFDEDRLSPGTPGNLKIRLGKPLEKATEPLAVIGDPSLVNRPEVFLESADGVIWEIASGKCRVENLIFPRAGQSLLISTLGENTFAACEFHGVAVVRGSPRNRFITPADRLVFSPGGIQFEGQASVENIVSGCRFKGGEEDDSPGFNIRILDAANNRIGLPGAGNTFLPSRQAILIEGQSATGNVIQGNGFNPFGALVEDDETAVTIRGQASQTLIGGERLEEANVFDFNRGIVIESGSRNRIIGNSIGVGAFTRIGIDLGGNGADERASPGNSTEPNGGIIPPVLEKLSTNRKQVRGALAGRAGHTYRLEFFANSRINVHPSSRFRGNGEKLVGFLNVSGGNAPVEFTFNSPQPIRGAVTATATDQDGNTSEFSNFLNEFIVNSLEDDRDQAFGDGAADTGKGGEGVVVCTLRSAIEEVNFANYPCKITFDFTGQNVGRQPTIRLQRTLDAIRQQMTIDGQVPEGRVFLDGTDASFGFGLRLVANQSLIANLALGHFRDSSGAISLASGSSNRVFNCAIGFLPFDNSPAPNGVGIKVNDGTDHSIQNCEIGFSLDDGIQIEGPNTQRIRLAGCKIGINDLGPIPNQGNGITFTNAFQCLVSLPWNTIAANISNGINISGGGGHEINFCMIGLDGFDRIPTQLQNVGIRIFNSSTNLIGSPDSLSRPKEGVNVISGHQLAGVAIIGELSRRNRVQANFIGTDSDGFVDAARKLGNENGVVVNGAPQTQVFGNLITGNRQDGVVLAFGAQDCQVAFNEIGARLTQDSIEGNGRFGVLVSESRNCRIGKSLLDEEGNRIVGNQKGIVVEDSRFITIQANTFRNNEGPGIDLGNDGKNPNDPGDGDSGPNDLLNHPIIRFGFAKSILAGGPARGIVTLEAEGSVGNYEFDVLGLGSLGQSDNYDVHHGTFSFSKTKFGREVFVFPIAGFDDEVVAGTLTDAFGNTSEISPGFKLLLNNDVTQGRLPDSVAGAINNGDGNRDGIADSDQGNVFTIVSFPDEAKRPAASELITVEMERNTVIIRFEARPGPKRTDPVPPPANAEFPLGVLDISLQGQIGASRTVALFVPENVKVNTYLKFGPTPDNRTPHWYEWLFDGQVGAEILSGKIILHLVDGGNGDDDLAANGTILDPGGPAFVRKLELLPPKLLAPGALQLEWPTEPGQAYRLETSSTLTNWTTRFTTNAAASMVIFTESLIPVTGHLFYRVVKP